MEKPARTQYPILDVLARRWSPRAFSDRLIEPQKLRRLFEALRWAPSSMNEQPWRFIIAAKDQPEAFDRLVSCLNEKNQRWAKHAPFLMISLSKKTFAYKARPNRVHIHDLGLAMGNFLAQATAMDLFVHQMAGIDLDRIIELYHIPEDFEPVAGCAVGYAGEPGSLPEEFRESEMSPRTRADFKDFVFSDAFGKPTDLFID